jgi:hypothetical protein
MAPGVSILGIGTVRIPGGGAAGSDVLAGRLQAALAAAAPDGPPVRLLHPIEELAVVAAHAALSGAGVPIPYGGDDLGIVLGVEEGIDGIKARYYRGVVEGGPAGASPLAFPLTTPNTVAARIAILFDLRGETVTVAAGGVSGAHAVGMAVRDLRDRRLSMALAGGVTCVEQEFLDGLAAVRPSAVGAPRGAACLLALAPGRPPGRATHGELMGYGEGFGTGDLTDAVGACLEDARMAPSDVGAVRTAAVRDRPSVVRAVRAAGVAAEIVPSSFADLHGAAFPSAVAEAVALAAPQGGGPILVVGSDCLAGAAAAVVRGGT